MVSFAAGQVLTPDDLLDLVGRIRIQSQDQAVTNSTTLVDTELVVPIDGPTVIELAVRYQSGTSGNPGGGIRYGWDVAGSVTGRRMFWHEESAVGDVQVRAVALDFVRQIGHITTASTMGIGEFIRADGSGTLTLQFAQETSHAQPTTVRGDAASGSWVTWRRVIDES